MECHLLFIVSPRPGHVGECGTLPASGFAFIIHFHYRPSHQGLPPAITDTNSRPCDIVYSLLWWGWLVVNNPSGTNAPAIKEWDPARPVYYLFSSLSSILARLACRNAPSSCSHRVRRPWPSFVYHLLYSLSTVIIYFFIIGDLDSLFYSIISTNN